MIRRESILHQLPVKLDRKQTVFLDGVTYSVQMADLAHTRLQNTLINDNPDHTSAVLDAWSIVDSLHRLRELLNQMPGVKRNSPTLQIFQRNTTQIEAMRHGVQHLRGEIDTLVAQNKPVWGSLSWVKPVGEREVDVGLLVAGTLSDYKGLPMVNPAGKSVSPPVDLITLTAYGHTVCLSEAMEYVERLVRKIEEQLHEKIQDLPAAAEEEPRIRLDL
jgi:hypothetical protein